ncbi:MAG TPA: hypothetical protein VEB65_02875 [Solirubrobacterales bacterium]|nr:hypothetical protein [Solirubrobacterales bacterium]
MQARLTTGGCGQQARVPRRRRREREQGADIAVTRHRVEVGRQQWPRGLDVGDALDVHGDERRRIGGGVEMLSQRGGYLERRQVGDIRIGGAVAHHRYRTSVGRGHLVQDGGVARVPGARDESIAAGAERRRIVARSGQGDDGLYGRTTRLVV